MTVPAEGAPANFVPAAAVIRLALAGGAALQRTGIAGCCVCGERPSDCRTSEETEEFPLRHRIRLGLGKVAVISMLEAFNAVG